MSNSTATTPSNPALTATNRFISRLYRPVDIAALVYFRIIFGGTMIFWAVKYLVAGFVTGLYINPKFHFTYQGFDWVQPLPGPLMYAEFIGIAILGLLIIIGASYRIASLLMAIAFTHIFLIDKTYYQNHYYLITMICWIAAILPANRAFSIDAINRPDIRSSTAPTWTIWLLRFQIGVPYFYGGIAKLNSDWLQGQPIRMMLADRTWYPFFGQYFTEEWAVYFFVYGGLLFDLLVVPALLYHRTRPWAFAVSLIFHMINATMFTIGVFPWFMMLATIVYFPPSWPRKLLATTRRHVVSENDADRKTVTWQTLPRQSRVFVTVLMIHVVFQCLWPLRVLVYDRNPSWTENGHFFSWHMLLRGKKAGLRFYAQPADTAELEVIPVARYLALTQARRLVRDPFLIKDLCRYLSRELRKDENEHLPVRVLALVSLNGRKPQLMINPDTDLAAEPRFFFSTPDWIPPLTEPLRHDAWDIPQAQWEKHIEVPADMAAAAVKQMQQRVTTATNADDSPD